MVERVADRKLGGMVGDCGEQAGQGGRKNASQDERLEALEMGSGD